MPRMLRRLAVALAAAGLTACAPRTASVDLASQLARVPVERSLGDGNLRIVSLYRPQAEALLDSAGRSRSEMLDRLVRDVYAPWPHFWNGYLGDEAAFRSWADEALFDPSHPVHRTLPSLLEAQLDSLFTESQAWLLATTGKTPRGTWYLVYGPGWTNMGGLAASGWWRTSRSSPPMRQRWRPSCRTSSPIRCTACVPRTRTPAPYSIAP